MQTLTRIVRPLRSGQITIPAEFREKMGIGEDTLLQLVLEGQELHIRPVQVVETAHGSAWARELYDLFAPVRQETADVTEEEVDADIDRAVKAARRKRVQGRS